MEEQKMHIKHRGGQQTEAGGLTANQKFMLRLRTFPNRSVRVLLQLDEQGQVVNAVFEEIGKVERFG